MSLSDLEITRKCAEAMGIYPNSKGCYVVGGITMKYDPLYNDAQAMALLKKFNPHADMGGAHCRFQKGKVSSGWHKFPEGLNRAICECVAAMETKAKIDERRYIG